MNRNDLVPSLAPPLRLACVTAAAVCAAAIGFGLLDLFDNASSERWLQPAPQRASAEARCDALRGAERTRCVQAQVERALANNERPAQVAAR